MRWAEGSSSGVKRAHDQIGLASEELMSGWYNNNRKGISLWVNLSRVSPWTEVHHSWMLAITKSSSKTKTMHYLCDTVVVHCAINVFLFVRRDLKFYITKVFVPVWLLTRGEVRYFASIAANCASFSKKMQTKGTISLNFGISVSWHTNTPGIDIHVIPGDLHPADSQILLFYLHWASAFMLCGLKWCSRNKGKTQYFGRRQEIEPTLCLAGWSP